MTRIIVCGGRDYNDFRTLSTALLRLREERGDFIIVHGDATGADQMADDWAADWGVPVERHPAKWKKHGRAAGPRRNAEMVALGADLCLAFPGGRGTEDCVRRCEEARIPVRRVGGAT